MILEIGIDPSRNAATVEGKVDHSHGSKGGGVLRWMSDPEKDHQSWSVKFKSTSPFVDDRMEFGATKGTDGGVLKKNRGEEAERYPYDVACTDSGGEEYGVDPEVVLWPE